MVKLVQVDIWMTVFLCVVHPELRVSGGLLLAAAGVSKHLQWSI